MLLARDFFGKKVEKTVCRDAYRRVKATETANFPCHVSIGSHASLAFIKKRAPLQYCLIANHYCVWTDRVT